VALPVVVESVQDEQDHLHTLVLPDLATRIAGSSLKFHYICTFIEKQIEKSILPDEGHAPVEVATHHFLN